MKSSKLLICAVLAASALATTANAASSDCEILNDVAYSTLVKNDGSTKGTDKACDLSTRGKVAVVEPNYDSGIIDFTVDGRTKYFDLKKSTSFATIPSNDPKYTLYTIGFSDKDYLFISSTAYAEKMAERWLKLNQD